MARQRRIGIPTAESVDDIWQRRATAAAIAAVRQVIDGDAIPKATPIGRLTDIELGWLLAAGLFAWIRTRGEQATAEGWDTEQTLRTTALDPQPWDAGAVAHILPRLAELDDIDWERPVGAWSKDAVISFLLAAMKLITTAMTARDVGSGGIATNRKPLKQMQRVASAEAGGPLAAPGELDDDIRDIPFGL
jgi:hypothetical protein